MKATVFLGAAILAFAAQQSVAQTQPAPRTPSPATPVHVTVPPGGLTFNFADIDRNGDNSISVEEWNAFVASLSSRVAQKAPGSAATGASAAPRTPQTPQR